MARGGIRIYLSVFFLAVTAGVVPAAADDRADALAAIESRWVDVRYVLKDKRERLDAAETLASSSKMLTDAYPGDAAALTWHALVILLKAEILSDLSALTSAKEAKTLLEQAEKIDSTVMNGKIHTTLAALYDEMPGWPVGFGDDKRARAHYAKALEIDPAGLDANYFFGDYLAQHGKYSQALPYLEKAVGARPRAGHERADAGRRLEAERALTLVRGKLR